MSDLGITWIDEGRFGVYVHTEPSGGLGHKANEIEARVLRRIDQLTARVEELEAQLHATDVARLEAEALLGALDRVR